VRGVKPSPVQNNDFERLKKKYRVEICKQKAGTKKSREKPKGG